jgi:hypothetical protein
MTILFPFYNTSQVISEILLHFCSGSSHDRTHGFKAAFLFAADRQNELYIGFDN